MQMRRVILFVHTQAINKSFNELLRGLRNDGVTIRIPDWTTSPRLTSMAWDGLMRTTSK